MFFYLFISLTRTFLRLHKFFNNENKNKSINQLFMITVGYNGWISRHEQDNIKVLGCTYGSWKLREPALNLFPGFTDKIANNNSQSLQKCHSRNKWNLKLMRKLSRCFTSLYFCFYTKTLYIQIHHLNVCFSFTINKTLTLVHFCLPDEPTCFTVLIGIIQIRIALYLQQDLDLSMSCFTLYVKVCVMLY